MTQVPIIQGVTKVIIKKSKLNRAGSVLALSFLMTVPCFAAPSPAAVTGPLPCYWVDDKRFDLPLAGSARGGGATAIAVVGPHVVVAGNMQNEAGIYSPCCWVDGKRNDLSVQDSGKGGVSSWMAVSSKSIYVAGSTTSSDGVDTPCYWTDGKRTDLSLLDPTTSGEMRDFVVSNNHVYAAGRSKSTDGVQVPCYWVDGKRIDLPAGDSGTGGWADRVLDPQKGGETNGFVVSGDHVYVVGTTQSTAGVSTPCYWVDGKRVDLHVQDPQKGGGVSWKDGVAVSGRHVYVSGETTNAAGVSTPCCWADGTRVDLPVPDPAKGASTSGLVVSGSHLYVMGEIPNQASEHGLPCYWKDGQRRDLPVADPGTWEEAVERIIVTDAHVYVFASSSFAALGNRCCWVDDKRVDGSRPDEVRFRERVRRGGQERLRRGNSESFTGLLTGGAVMRIPRSILMLSLVAFVFSCQSESPSPPAPATADTGITKSVQKDGLTLSWCMNNQAIDDTTIRLFTDEFFSVYPRLRARFNPRASDRVTIVVDPGYQGAARTEVNVVRYSAAFLAANPKETGSLTHELTHVVQGYPGERNEPPWLTEGIAEYARYLYATDDFARSGWKLPVVFASDRYTDSYRVTGRFLVWLDRHKGAAVIDGLDSSMRRGDYSDAVWTRLTGKTVDELWRQYLETADLNDGKTVTVLPAVVSQGCSLSVDVTGGTCTSQQLQRISDLFFSLYPKVCKRFQIVTPQPVRLLVNFEEPGDCRFDSLEPGMIILSEVYFNKDKNALGVLEYNLVCTALAYPSWGWLQTGLAVYGRYRYGTSDAVTGWSLPAYDAAQHLTDGFDVTARFLVWAEATYGARVVDGIDAALRNGSCSPSDWKRLCGYTTDELWSQYAASPKIP